MANEEQTQSEQNATQEQQKPDQKTTQANQTTKKKTIKVKSTRQINLGKLEKHGKILNFPEKGVVREVPYTEETQRVIDEALNNGFLVKE